MTGLTGAESDGFYFNHNRPNLTWTASLTNVYNALELQRFVEYYIFAIASLAIFTDK